MKGIQPIKTPASVTPKFASGEHRQETQPNCSQQTENTIKYDKVFSNAEKDKSYLEKPLQQSE